MHKFEKHVIADRMDSSNTLVLSFATSFKSPELLSNIPRPSTTLQTNLHPALWEKNQATVFVFNIYMCVYISFYVFHSNKTTKHYDTNMLILFSGFLTPNTEHKYSFKMVYVLFWNFKAKKLQWNLLHKDIAYIPSHHGIFANMFTNAEKIKFVSLKFVLNHLILKLLYRIFANTECIPFTQTHIFVNRI